jgi:allophanate hydrolase subunit 1
MVDGGGTSCRAGATGAGGAASAVTSARAEGGHVIVGSTDSPSSMCDFHSEIAFAFPPFAAL